MIDDTVGADTRYGKATKVTVHGGREIQKMKSLKETGEGRCGRTLQR